MLPDTDTAGSTNVDEDGLKITDGVADELPFD